MPPIAAVARPATAPALERIEWAVSGLNIEIPSWGFVNTGTRFRVFPQPGVPRTVVREDRRRGHRQPVHGDRGLGRRSTSRGTGSTTTRRSRPTRRERGLRIGGINSNTFQDEDYKLGSLCHPGRARPGEGRRGPSSSAARSPAATGSKAVKVWLGDGTNYPGQDDLRWRRHRLVEGLREVYPHLPGGRAPVPRVQALRAGPLLHRRPGLGPGARGLPRGRRAGRRSASTPATTRWASTSSRSWRSSSPRAASAASTSTTRSTATTT